MRGDSARARSAVRNNAPFNTPISRRGSPSLSPAIAAASRSTAAAISASPWRIARRPAGKAVLIRGRRSSPDPQLDAAFDEDAPGASRLQLPRRRLNPLEAHIGQPDVLGEDAPEPAAHGAARRLLRLLAKNVGAACDGPV